MDEPSASLVLKKKQKNCGSLANQNKSQADPVHLNDSQSNVTRQNGSQSLKKTCLSFLQFSRTRL